MLPNKPLLNKMWLKHKFQKLLKNRSFVISLVINFSLVTWLVFLLFIAKPVSVVKESFYPFISRRVLVENKNDTIINLMPLREALIDYSKKTVDKVGIYFEFLPSGNSIGINEKDQYRVSSLAKVPNVMGIYKKIS